MSDYLFVYGTLRRDACFPMAKRLSRDAEFVDKAAFQGKLFSVDYYPGAVPSKEPGDIVHGEVHRLRQPQSALAWLDEYEGGSAEAGGEYIRRTTWVVLGNGSRIQAWIYLYARPTQRLERIHSGDFLRRS